MSLSRAWYTDANRAVEDHSSALLLAKSILWGLKALLRLQIAGTNGPEGPPPAGAAWTCLGSSDGVTAALDGVDRWGATFDATKIVRAAGAVAHSWIVLQSPAAMGPYYFAIDWNTSSDTLCNFYLSKAAPTGGSITARPTAADEIALATQTFAESVTTGHKLHRITDASGNWFFATSNNSTGIANWFFGVQTLTETKAGDLFPVVMMAQFLTSGRGVPGVGIVTQHRTATNSAAATGGINHPTFGGSQFATMAQSNIIDGKWDTFSAYFGSFTAGRVRHPRAGF